MNEFVIQVRDFTKSYGKYVAVNGISFDVKQGEIFGLLGPNGAGKTSTLECLEGLRFPNGGSLEIMGVNPVSQSRKLRNIIGVQLQTSGLPDTIQVNEAVRFFSAYHCVKPNYDLLDRLGLNEKRNAQYHELSTGQKRRLALVLAILHNPPVLFLDEPTAGLDVASRVELHNIMRELKSAGTTIILATHDMAEAEEMTDRVAILLRGKIAASGTPLELTASSAGFTKISVRTKGSSLLESDIVLPSVKQNLFKNEYAIYYSTNIGSTVSTIINYIEGHGDTLIDLRVERPSLEERFLEITNTGGV